MCIILAPDVRMILALLLGLRFIAYVFYPKLQSHPLRFCRQSSGPCWRTSTSSKLVFCCLSKTHHPLHPYLRRIANINYQINLAVIHVCFQCPRRTRRLICRLYDPFIHLLYSQGSHRRSYVRPLALVFGECQSDF